MLRPIQQASEDLEARNTNAAFVMLGLQVPLQQLQVPVLELRLMRQARLIEGSNDMTIARAKSKLHPFHLSRQRARNSVGAVVESCKSALRRLKRGKNLSEVQWTSKEDLWTIRDTPSRRCRLIVWARRMMIAVSPPQAKIWILFHELVWPQGQMSLCRIRSRRRLLTGRLQSRNLGSTTTG